MHTRNPDFAGGRRGAVRPRYHEQGIQVIESAAPYELIHSFRHEIVGWSKLVQDAGLAHSQ